MSKFKATVTKEFIERRDKNAVKFKAGIRGADAEFIEYHQSLIDPLQTLYEKMEYDTVHEILGNIDYKQYSREGVHIGKYCQNLIKKGKVHKIGIWRWLPRNQWEELYEGKTVQYEIIDYIDADRLIEYIDQRDRFSLEDCDI